MTDPAALDIRPLTPDILDDMARVMRGSWGTGCWCMHPRLTERQTRELAGTGPQGPARRAAMEERAARAPSPGLLAYAGGAPVGWVAVAPRGELARVAASPATPPVDDLPVWVIPCVTVRRDFRGQGIALALIRAAVAHAGAHGAPAVEAYPRAGDARTGDDNAFFGTEPMFARAGFNVIRRAAPARRNWTPRVTMRIATGA